MRHRTTSLSVRKNDIYCKLGHKEHVKESDITSGGALCVGSSSVRGHAAVNSNAEATLFDYAQW